MLSVMVGRDDRIPISIDTDGSEFINVTDDDIKGLRIAWSPDLGIVEVDAEVVQMCEQAVQHFQDLGCVVEPACPNFSTVQEMIPPLRAYRSAAVFSQLLETKGELVDNDFFKKFLSLAEQVSVADAGRAESQRYQLWLDTQRFFQDYDLLICPSTQTTAFPIEQLYPAEINGQPMGDLVESILLTYAITLLGVPAISVPAGWTQAGMPVGLQIIGGRLQETTVLRAAAALEGVAPWLPKLKQNTYYQAQTQTNVE